MNTYIQCPYCGSAFCIPEKYKNNKRQFCHNCNRSFDMTKTAEYADIKKAEKKRQRKQTGGLQSPPQKTYFQTNAQRVEENTKRNKNGKKGMIFCVIAICVILYQCGDFEHNETPLIGDRVSVVQNTFGTYDKDNDDLGRSIVAGDAIGIYEQTSSGKAKHIWSGQGGKVVRHSWTKSQVRLDDGSLYWIPTEHIKKE